MLIAINSGTDRHIERLKKNLINHKFTTHSTLGEKNGELWSTNKKVLVVHIDQSKWIFFLETIFRQLGVLRPEIFKRARD